ncbi:MAG: BamA/TamA family outer membrane protein [Cyclobacteriaceae bacterium]|nr:BamA/TamA family outer membrane protein [Cyclobacteriaceae bacterium HetDA_MAG_MS6]
MRIALTLSILLAYFPSSAQDVSLYLFGNTGAIQPAGSTDWSSFQTQWKDASENDILVALGDYIYPRGLLGEDKKARVDAEASFNRQLEMFKSFPGRVYMIPGDRDWAGAGRYGWDAIRELEGYTHMYLDQDSVFLPKNGCPGPIEIQVSNQLTLVLVDFAYFLHPWDRPREEEGCGASSTTEAIGQLEDIVKRNVNKHLVIASHHPLRSYGVYGGKFSFRQHLFPLTDIRGLGGFYLPTPVIGSLYPAYRSVSGGSQDLSSPKYRLIRKVIRDIISKNNDVIWASAHDQSLQYITEAGSHLIVTGSAAQGLPTKEGKGTVFASSARGLARVDISVEGQTSLNFIGEKGDVLFERKLYQKEVASRSVEAYVRPDFTDSIVRKAINPFYLERSGKWHNFWFGKNYRELWATPVDVPVFDKDSEHGGLEIVKLGGGFQTKSLRLKTKDKKQYVLRSLDKYPRRILPAELKNTFAGDWFKDYMSSANPYGAFAVPILADAAGIYHTNPSMVMIPDDPSFGRYRDDFAGLMALYEERPTSKVADLPHFGGGEKIIGTPDLLTEMRADNDEIVDQNFAVRNRLFDLWLGDWDRHFDQWRWVRYDHPTEKGHIYRPLPRDRDQAFVKADGFIPFLIGRKFAFPYLQGFDEKIEHVPQFTSSTTHFFDRAFLNEPEWSEWQKEAQHLQHSLTDEIIEKSIAVWPREIYEQRGKQTIAHLKSRRDDIVNYGNDLYKFLAEEVDILGSDKDEYFLVERLNDQETRVTIRKYKKDKIKDAGRVVYQRTFKNDETKEVRLYGFGGQDLFELIGEVNKGIKVRIIGGRKKDKVIDQSKVSGLGKKTLVYDRKKNTSVQKSGETSLKLAKSSEVHRYDYKSYKFDKTIPLLSAQFNVDDGIFLGAGFIHTDQAWRKSPYASQHTFIANAALATRSYNFKYKGKYSQILGKWGLETVLNVQSPFFVTNFFGLGNESTFDFEGNNIPNFDDPIDFYRIRTDIGYVGASFFRQIGEKGEFSVGSISRRAKVELQDGKFINDPGNGLDLDKISEDHLYSGVRSAFSLDARDNSILPSRGVYFNASVERQWGLNDVAEDFTMLSSDFSFYLSTRLPARLVLASRVTFQHLLEDDVEFFNLAKLGGRSNLRGFRRTRFYGHTAFTHNLDLRLKLFSFRTYIFPGSLGLLGFYDTGRVWLDGEQSDTWHNGGGFGLWLAPLNQAVFTFNYAFTKEENIPTVSFGYFF